MLLYWYWRGIERSKCNRPVDCCRRRLDGGAPLFSPTGRKCNSIPLGSTKKELLLGYESVLIMVLFCCIFHFFRQQGCIPPLAAFSYTVIVAFVGNRGIYGLSWNLWVIVALLIIESISIIIYTTSDRLCPFYWT